MENIHNKISKKSFPVTGMTCSACAKSVETILNHTEGVQSANVNLATNTVFLEFDSAKNPLEFRDALRNVGYDLIVESSESADMEDLAKNRLNKLKYSTIWSFTFTLPVFIISMFFMDWGPGRYISFALTIPVVFWFGNHFYINAFKHARHGFANMDTLVALSTGIAFIFSVFNVVFPDFLLSKGFEPHVYFESVGVIISFISTGKWLEEKAKAGTSTSIKKLLNLQVKRLFVEREGRVLEISDKEVEIGDLVIIKPGANIPVDGTIYSGNSYIDESMMTGEPIPVYKKEGDAVFAGTTNQKGSFRFRAEKVGNDTYLARIIALVQEAQGSKAPVQRLADRIAGIFVPVVIIFSVITFVVWYLLGGENAFTHAFLNAIAVLVISCPCALGLATPTAIMVGIGKGAENNILIKDAESLERATKADVVILDKTGTITEGKPKVIQLVWLDPKYNNLASVILAMELRSEHPLAEAITEYLAEKKSHPSEIHDFNSMTGSGIMASTKDGETYFLGNYKLLNEYFQQNGGGINQYEHFKGTVVYFFTRDKLLAQILIEDTVRESAKTAIEALSKNNAEVHLLSGDNEKTVEDVAVKLGIPFYKSNVLPDEKASYIKRLQTSGHVVAMVGDGINDAHALAQADISIAMGKGSDIAIDVAKMTLIGSDLRMLPKAFKLSKMTVRGIHQNLFWAFIYNIIGIPVAAGVLYPINGFLLDPMIAGAAMALSSVSVVTNSLRLKWKKL